jgi:hypothetical protein
MIPDGDHCPKTQAMALSRTTIVLAALFSVVSLAGCGSSEAPSSSAPPTSAPPTSAAPNASADASGTWAQGVCLASTDLRESIGKMSGPVSIDSSGSSTSVDQVHAEVNARIAAVRQSATALQTALTALPAGADPELVATQQQLQTAAQRAQQAVGQLSDAATKVADATTAATLATALAALTATLTGTSADVNAYLDALRGSVGSGQEAVQRAFGAAPACADVRPTSSASG